jgi:soluble lytic murein transglycosylase
LAPVILALCLNAQTIPSDYRAYLTAVDASAQGRHADAVAALDAVWSFRPESPLIGNAAMLAARSHVQLGQPREALSVLRRWESRLPRPQGELALAAAAEASGETGLAAGSYQRVFYEYPLSDEAKEADAALSRLAAGAPPVMPRAVFERAEILRKAGQAARAKQELLTALANFTGHDRELALVRAHHGDYRGLAALQVTEAEADAERLYLMHAAARRNSIEAQAAAALGELEKRFPQSNWTMEALISWGNHYLLRNQPDSYAPLYRACVERFAQDRQAAYCHWKLTWLAWMRRDANARVLMQEHAARFPASDNAAAALYFAGRYAAVLDRYPLSFYAALAREKVGEVAQAVPNTELFTPAAVTRLRLDRARQLEQAGHADWSEFELKFAAQEQPFVAAMELAELMSKRGSHDQALRYIKGLAKGYLTLPLESAPQRFWQLAFPLPFRESVVSHSGANQLDPNIVAALIRQESEFNPNAVSRARAYGLTQVLPSTGRQLSRRLGVRGFRSSMLFDPDVNLRLGTHYLKSLLDANGGRWEAALASYNAGQSRVNQWAGWFEYREPAEFIETIPFSETRNYVQIVMRNADVYRRLYRQNGLAGVRAGTSGGVAP